MGQEILNTNDIFPGYLQLPNKYKVFSLSYIQLDASVKVNLQLQNIC